jgi:hypothetical protein
MAADTQILREYLVALGFRVNEKQHKNFLGTLGGLDKKALGLSKAVIGVGTAIVTMTTLFSKSMERLYYSSRYANTTAAQLQAIEFGAGQIGMKAGEASNGIKAMTAAMRANPGLVGLLQGKFGIQAEGRDSADVWLDLVGKLAEMPPYIGQQFGAMFGMDPEMLFNAIQGREEMMKARELRKQMAAEMGVDADAAAKLGKEYMNMWREVTERVGLFGQLLTIQLQGPIKDFLSATNQLLIDWSRITQEINKAGTTDFWQKIVEGVTDKTTEGGVQLTPEAKQRLGIEDLPYTAPKGNVGIGKKLEDYFRWRDGRGRAQRERGVPEEPRKYGRDDIVGDKPEIAPRGPGKRKRQGKESAPPGETSGEQMSRAEALEMFANLEKQYDLPAGLLDKVWAKESGRGKNMVGRTLKNGDVAEGHFQFTGKTQEEYGLVDPYNLSESADKAAEKLSELMQRYKGDLRMALAAYNYGDGNLGKIGYDLGRAPAETRDYVDTIAGKQPTELKQETNIHIHGVTDPKEAGRAVAQEQQAVNAELVRNFKPKVR